MPSIYATGFKSGKPIRGIPTLKDIQRFVSKLIVKQASTNPKYKNSPCWIYSGCVNRDGYGVFHFNGRKHLSNRISFYFFRRDLVKREEVDHDCFVPACCHPWHVDGSDRKSNNRKKNLNNPNRKRKVKPLPDKPNDGIPV